MFRCLSVASLFVVAACAAPDEQATSTSPEVARQMQEACVELRRALFQDSIVRSYTVYPRCDNGRVVLNGTVPDFAARQQAEILAAQVPGVRQVQNNLKVADPDDPVRY